MDFVPKDLPRDIGEFIRDMRRNARISLRQLANQAGVSNPYLSQIERGLRKPSAEVLQQIANALRVSTPVMYLRAGPCSDSDQGTDGGPGSELACGLFFPGQPAAFTTGPLSAGDYYLWVDSLYLGEGTGALTVTVP